MRALISESQSSRTQHRENGLSDNHDYAEWAAGLALSDIERLFRSVGCDSSVLKLLAPNDNSKNQIYVGADLTDLAEIPSGAVRQESGSSRKPGSFAKTIFHSAVQFAWLDSTGTIPAASAQLIFYPQYPEVRLSGILQGVRGGPSSLLNPQKRGREVGRVLFLGINMARGAVFGILVPSSAPAATEIHSAEIFPYGALQSWKLSWVQGPTIQHGASNRSILLAELCRIHRKGWIPSCRLSTSGPIPYAARNGGGYTLEAELGITPNGDANPDFLGWEVKQHTVGSLDRPRPGTITLMTPQPDDGYYAENNAVDFVKRWGRFRDDTRSRMDFTGTHKVGVTNPTTGLSLAIEGFNSSTGFTGTTGRLVLKDDQGVVAAGWTFGKLLTHWKRKHTAAVYVASESRQSGSDATTEYRYGENLMLGEGASFEHLLQALEAGSVLYDPGIRITRGSKGQWVAKQRNQLRVRPAHLANLYDTFTEVHACGK